MTHRDKDGPTRFQKWRAVEAAFADGLRILSERNVQRKICEDELNNGGDEQWSVLCKS